jgi:hypothetical protein
MTVHFFPKDDPDLAGVISYSTPYRVFCPQRPFRGTSALQNLELARDELHKGGRDGLVNALGNSRRCLSRRVDTLLHAFGLRKATSRVIFPMKLDLLKDLRIIPDGMLRLYGLVRDALEYDRLAPTREMAHRAIDLCEVFLPATERYLAETPACVRVVLSNDDRDMLFLLDSETGFIHGLLITGSTPQETEHGKYYTPPLFNLSGTALSDGLSLEPSPKEDLWLKLETKESWLPILRIFSFAASGPSPSHARLPDEPQAKFETFVSSPVAKEVIEKPLSASK